MSVPKAVETLRNGGPVLLYDFDNREAEVDLVMHARYITEKHVNFMRRAAGGLICFATTETLLKSLGLPFMTEILNRVGLGRLARRPRYGDEPAFSIYVNHVDTATGIRDSDRAMTIVKLWEVVELAGRNMEKAREKFFAEFYSPGHLPVLGARVGVRWGHTEMAVILARLSGLSPAVVIVEYLGEGTEPITLSDAERIGSSIGAPVVKGEEVKQYWEALSDAAKASTSAIPQI